MAGEAGYEHTPQNIHYVAQFKDTAIAFIVLEVFVALLRVLAKALPRHTRIGWDDFFLLPSLLANIAQNAVAIVSAWYLNDYLVRADDDPEIGNDAEKFLIAIWILQFLYALALTLPKLSVLCLYLRLLTDKLTRTLTWITFAFVAGTGIGYFFSTVFICVPISSFWNGQPGTCVQEQALHQAISVLSVAADVAILLLPLQTIFTITASRARKLGIFLTIAIGSLGLIAAIVRLVLWFKIDILSTNLRGPLLLDMWSFVETGIYFFAACMPALRALFTYGPDRLRVLTGRPPLSSSNSQPLARGDEFSQSGSDRATDSKSRFSQRLCRADSTADLEL